MILHMLAGMKFNGWSTMASVCREWYSILGKRNLSHIRVSQNNLSEFRQLQLGLPFVEHVNLCVDLEPNFSCMVCPHWKTPAEDRVGRLIQFTHALNWVICIMGHWKHDMGPLTLELNAYAASATKHLFQNYRFDDDFDKDISCDEWALTGGPAKERDDPHHGFIGGQHLWVPPYFLMQDQFHPLPVEICRNLLPVPTVTRLMIRRQFRHHIPPSNMHLLISKFPCLKELVYEHWCPEYTEFREDYLHWKNYSTGK